MHAIAAKAVAFGEALRPPFNAYVAAVVENAKMLGMTLQEHGLKLVTGGTDTHLLLVDLQPQSLTGIVVERSLERAAITCNKNAVPFDPRKPSATSGIRLGTPAGTTRGFGTAEYRRIGELICQVIEGLVVHGEEANKDVETRVKSQVLNLCRRFPIYSGLYQS